MTTPITFERYDFTSETFTDVIVSMKSYKTERILQQIEQNDNQYSEFKFDMLTSGSLNPEIPDQAFADVLDTLFQNGAEIALETHTGFDDDGGDCYQCYIVKPEWRDAFHHYLDTTIDDDCFIFHIAAMRYVVMNSNHIAIVWAGPC